MDFQKAKPILVIATLIGMGVGLLGFGWDRVRTDRLLDRSSAATEGRVMDSWVHTGSRGGEWPTLVVEYVPTAHAPITRKFDVNQTTYQTALETRKVTVHYFPEDPRISRVTRFETLPFQLLTGLGGAILLAGFFCFVHYMKKRSKVGPGGQPGAEPG
ncbi:MAG: hypothetical protein ACRCXD_14400 [Luteolibacter sp.]